jgi:hypothetical protein
VTARIHVCYKYKMQALEVALLSFLTITALALLAAGFVRAAVREGFLVWAVTEDPVRKLGVCRAAGFPSIDAIAARAPSYLEARDASRCALDDLKVSREPSDRQVLLTALPERELLLCVSPTLQHVKDIAPNALTMHYVEPRHRAAMAAVLRSFGIALAGWEQAPDHAAMVAAVAASPTPAAGVVLAPRGHPALASLKTSSLQALSYDGIDVHRARVMLPHAVYQAVDVAELLPARYPRAEVRMLLAFDAFLAAPTYPTAFDRHYAKVLDGLDKDTLARNNYYRKYYRFHHVTEARLRASDAAMQAEAQGAGFRLREGFGGLATVGRSDPPVQVRLEDGLPPGAWMTPAAGAPKGVWTLTFPVRATGGGVRLRAGDRVLLDPAPDSFLPAFDAWYVVAADAKAATLTSHWPVTRKAEDFARASASREATLLPGGSRVRTEDGLLGTLGEDGAFAPDAKKPSPGMCINKPWIRSEAECTAARSAMDRLGAGTWDQPCASHADCPFFQANRRYPNYRGGCLAGFCEMPVGVTRVGYRKHAGSPYCHGCSDTGTLPPEDCCARQTVPDVAFPLDQVERAR